MTNKPERSEGSVSEVPHRGLMEFRAELADQGQHNLRQSQAELAGQDPHNPRQDQHPLELRNLRHHPLQQQAQHLQDHLRAWGHSGDLG